MIRPTPVIFMGSSDKIVYKINLISVMVHELKYYFDENVYNKPMKNNGLLDKPYICLTYTQCYGERL